MSLRLSEGFRGLHPGGQHQRQIEIGNRAMPFLAILGILDVAAHLQFVGHASDQDKQPVGLPTMMVAAVAGHVDNERVVEHRAVAFRDAIELLGHVRDVVQVQLLDLHSATQPIPPVRRDAGIVVAKGVDVFLYAICLPWQTTLSNNSVRVHW